MIGETAVREGKVEGLLAADVGSVTVVAERPAARLESLAALDPRVTVERRAWRPADLDGAFVCVASSDDPAERAAVAREARDRGVLVNVMDDIPNCDWSAPSIVRRGELVLAISTGGASPALAKQLRLQLSADVRRGMGRGARRPARRARRRRCRSSPTSANARRGGPPRWTRRRRRRSSASGRADELRERLVRRLLEDAPTPRPTGHRLPGRRRPGRPEAHHGSRRRGARARRRRRLRPPGVARRCSTWRRRRPSASTSARSRAARRCRRTRSTRCSSNARSTVRPWCD